VIAMERKSHRILWSIRLWVLPVLTGILALGIGRIWISPAEIAAAVGDVFSGTDASPALTDMTLWNLRLPRILLAALVGVVTLSVKEQLDRENDAACVRMLSREYSL